MSKACLLDKVVTVPESMSKMLYNGEKIIGIEQSSVKI